jgi:hypothetical protein
MYELAAFSSSYTRDSPWTLQTVSVTEPGGWSEYANLFTPLRLVGLELRKDPSRIVSAMELIAQFQGSAESVPGGFAVP